MIFLEKKDFFSGFVKFKENYDNRYVYYHIEVNKEESNLELDLMLCTKEYKYLAVKLNKENATSITDNKYIFNGKVLNIDKFISSNINIVVAIYKKNTCIVTNYMKKEKFDIENLSIKYELYSSNMSNNLNNIEKEISLTSINPQEKQIENHQKTTLKINPLKNTLKPISSNKTHEDKDIKLIQTYELLEKIKNQATSIKEMYDGRNKSIAFKINYNNFKKISLLENIYYIPINLVVSMLKKEILKTEKIIITIILKKNSPYIKCIQLCIIINEDEILLKGLSNFKYYKNKDTNLTYLIYSYMI